MHAKYEVSISYGSKVIVKVKVDNGQTDRQTDQQSADGQDKNNMPDLSIAGAYNFWRPTGANGNNCTNT